MATGLFEGVKPSVNFPELEVTTSDFWKREQIFKKTLDATRLKPFYSFYDGPPFATGTPHYGHLIGGVLKDVVPRYWTMRGYHVPRRFGWDCHGLPVEYEINKSLKIESSKQVHAMGVAKYNEACRNLVTHYVRDEWRKITDRVGRWVDMDRPYFTMDASFMESVWWVFGELFKKGLIYEGYKVVPYSTGVSTALSNFEAQQNYKEVQDPALTVLFRGVGRADEPVSYFAAWTTTPWTLPSNMALMVNREVSYVLVKDPKSGLNVWVAEPLVSSVLPTAPGEAAPEVLKKVLGAELLEQRYEPLFPYFGAKAGAFRVIESDHVTTDAGTGIVHCAPAFGEDDFYAAERAGVPLVNPVDDDGCFTSEVPDFQGVRVKDADRDIIARLKTEKKLLKHETLVHSYPFCWRSDTPLIYRAVSTWFVKLDPIKEQLLQANTTTRWVPDHVREGRFGNWLANARDWAISRNRFWGTPIPIWKNKEGEVVCISSVAELERIAGRKITDLHMESIDDIEIPSPTGKSSLKRVPPVLDCWFESGSMPYAQWAYPAEHREEFEKAFPADFIAEGIDQTRGWFYTLMVIGTALRGQAPFKNVIVNGLILAEDGKKMSKRLKNYPDPGEVLNAHGADALRLYLISSPAVRAQELRFSENGVREIVRKILLRWWNAYSFFVSYANIDGFKPQGRAYESKNPLDRWILSRLNRLIELTHREMEAYRVYNVTPVLLNFVEELTNTYIRFNRRHFWQAGMPADKVAAYETLYEVLYRMSLVMAPFAPFITEVMYANLSRGVVSKKESVHLEAYPEVKAGSVLDDRLEGAVARMDALVEMGRYLREQMKVKAKIPLNSIRIIHRDSTVLNDLKGLESYFIEELNVRQVIYESNEDAYVKVTAKADFKKLGPKFGPKMKTVAAAIQALTLDQLLALESGQVLSLAGESISLADVEVRRAALRESKHFATSQVLSIEFDPTVTPEQEREGTMREVVRAIQAARKAADLNFEDRIHTTIACNDALWSVIEQHQKVIEAETLSRTLTRGDVNSVEPTPLGDEWGTLAVGVRRV